MEKKHSITDEEILANNAHADLPGLCEQTFEELLNVYRVLSDCEDRLLKIADKNNIEELHIVGYALRGLHDARNMIFEIIDV